MYFTMEEENPLCLYHNAKRRRAAVSLRTVLPDTDKGMATLACQTTDKLDVMNDADFTAQWFHFTGE